MDETGVPVLGQRRDHSSTFSKVLAKPRYTPDIGNARGRDKFDAVQDLESVYRTEKLVMRVTWAFGPSLRDENQRRRHRDHRENSMETRTPCPPRLRGDHFSTERSVSQNRSPGMTEGRAVGRGSVGSRYLAGGESLCSRGSLAWFLWHSHLETMAERSRVRRSSGSSYRWESR